MTPKEKEMVKDLRKRGKMYEKGFYIMMEYFDDIYDDEKPKVDKKLKKLGL